MKIDVYHWNNIVNKIYTKKKKYAHTLLLSQIKYENKNKLVPPSADKYYITKKIIFIGEVK